MCGQQQNIDDLVKLNEELDAQIKDLKLENEEKAAIIEKLKLKNEENSERCLRLTDALNAKILKNPHDDVFTEIEGFPSKEKLKKFSEAGQNSDYIFVKLLMHELWPSGLHNRSVTGRASNNPRGRNRTDGAGSWDRIVAGLPKTPLEPNKVTYVEGK